ncbi:hypothetical protein UPYG_G00263830 [Umbra pygmaea]|uniref:Interleukin-17C n=1 Tax=Umbra pygmaea TaxID=75934 RepID=A0ABD0WB11_UMBPY
MQAILLLGILIGQLSWASEAQKHIGCFRVNELEAGAQRILRRHRYLTDVQVHGALDHKNTEKKCPTSRQSFSHDFSNRSVSPWRYSIDTEEGRFPKEIVVAECLCKGCIINNRSGHQVEDHNYNSVPIMQSKVVLTKTQCSTDPEKYSFTKSFIQVPIACTCVRYRSI